MKIGILSDTHGNIESTKWAAEIFKAAGVKAVLHCGDIGGSEVLTELASVFQPLNIPVYAVWGNVDVYASDWKFFPSNIGVQLLGRFGSLELGEKKIAVLHSDDRVRFRQIIDEGQYDFVFFGHSHELHDQMVGSTRCINPGTAGRGAPNTCVVLDLLSGDLTVTSYV